MKISRGIGPQAVVRELPPSAGLGCAAGSCGACCDPVLLSYPRERLDALAAQYPHDMGVRATADFTAANWHLVAQLVRVEAEDGTVTFRGKRPADPEPDDYEGEWRYSCDAYDPGTRLCTAHTARPPICEGALWYGKRPDASIPLGDPLRPDGLLGVAVPGDGRAHCSYLLDLWPDQRPEGTRPLIPITPI